MFCTIMRVNNKTHFVHAELQTLTVSEIAKHIHLYILLENVDPFVQLLSPAGDQLRAVYL